MNKILFLVFFVATSAMHSQNLLTEDYNVFPAISPPGASDQWINTNQSTPSGPGNWMQGGGTLFATAHSGTPTSFARVTYQSATGNGTISNWLISPTVNLVNGDVISFWTRQGGTVPEFPDRLELRIDTNWSEDSVLPALGSSDLANFTNLVLSVNPNLTVSGYPLTWTNYTYTVSGLPTASTSRIAFRYFVTNGGTLGQNSNTIGIDTFSVDRPLSTEGFFASNFAVYPNPATNVLNINTKGSTSMNQIQLTDINGRIVKTVNAAQVSETQINIGDLNSGVYFLKISSDLGVGTSKIIKN